MKAKTAKIPRIVKSWRLKQETARLIAKLAAKTNQAQSELIEKTFDQLDKKIV